jgi:hypothetical protein
MTSPDAAWLHMDRATNPMVINSVLWCDEPVDWERLRASFRERVVERFDRFRQRPVEGLAGLGAHWEDVDDFDLELHFHHVALPAPGDRHALQELVSDRASVPLDRSRPLWEIYLIDGLGPGAAVLARMHHSIADGIALALGRLDPLMFHHHHRMHRGATDEIPPELLRFGIQFVSSSAPLRGRAGASCPAEPGAGARR